MFHLWMPQPFVPKREAPSVRGGCAVVRPSADASIKRRWPDFKDGITETWGYVIPKYAARCNTVWLVNGVHECAYEIERKLTWI